MCVILNTLILGSFLFYPFFFLSHSGVPSSYDVCVYIRCVRYMQAYAAIHTRSGERSLGCVQAS